MMWVYNYTPNQDDIMHYGVLGMKWGVHRARKKGATYRYQSLRTKYAKRFASEMNRNADRKKERADEYRAEGKQKKAKKYEIKAKEARQNADSQKRWADASAKHDKEMQKIAGKMSTGKAIAQTLLTGGLNKTYHSVLVSGEGSISKGKAAAAAFFGGADAENYYMQKYLTRNSK